MARQKYGENTWIDKEIGTGQGRGGGGDCDELCSDYKFLIDKYCCQYGSPGTGLLDLMEPEAIYLGFVRPVAGLMQNLSGSLRSMIRASASQSASHMWLVKALNKLDPEGNSGILPQLAPPDSGPEINGVNEEGSIKEFKVTNFDLDMNQPEPDYPYHSWIYDIDLPDEHPGLLTWTRFCETLGQVQTYYGDLLPALKSVFGEENLPSHADQDIMRYLVWPVYMPRLELVMWIDVGQELFL